MGRGPEIDKRSGRDEPMWVAIPKCIEAAQSISLYSYSYFKLAKTMSFLLSLMFSFQQNWKTRGWDRFFLEVGMCGREQAQTMYTHVRNIKTIK
jgi:hypothetical protein